MNWRSSVFSLELRKILAFRSEFWVTFLGQTLIQLVIARALWQSVFEATGTEAMQGFNLETMTLYYLIVPIGSRILTGENVGFISREIYDGTFSRYLIYPLSFFQYKSITYLTYSLFYSLQLGILFHLYHVIFKLPLPPTANFILGMGFFLLGSVVYCFMAMFLELISLWAENIWSLLVMLRFFTSFFGGGFIPLSFFPEWGQEIVKWTPFPYLISLPTRTIMGLVSDPQEYITAFFILLLWILIFFGAVKLLWQRGQKSFTGVGI